LYTRFYSCIIGTNCHSAMSNSLASRLLRLSAELRNDIYERLLGGHTYYVHQNAHSHWQRNKTASDPSFSIHHDNRMIDVEASLPPPFITQLFRLSPEIRNGIYDYVLDQPSAATDTVERLRIALLRVSRQTHAETSLLLYCANTFTFDSIDALRAFVNQCSEAQIVAVGRIILRTWRDASFLYSPNSRSNEGWGVLAAFPGLVCVEIIDIVLFECKEPSATAVGNLRKIVALIRKYKPGVKISARQDWEDAGRQFVVKCHLGDL